MRRSLLSVSAAAATFAALATACGGGSSSSFKSSGAVPANAVVVQLKNLAFRPSTVTIKAGQTVAWEFVDGNIAHNVTAEGYHSPDRTSGIFTHVFATAGDYKYDCTIHSGMNGEVVVK